MMILFSLLVVFFHTKGYCNPSKRALVIGNSAYQDVSLPHAVRDANEMTATLEEIGFVVTTHLNATQQTLTQIIHTFAQELQPDDVVFVYFSGHGAQVDQVNYLIPIGAHILSEEDIPHKAVAVHEILDAIHTIHNQITFIILEACWENPLPKVRLSHQGLAPMSSPQDTVIAYATTPGMVIARTPPPAQSLYTTRLIEHITTPGSTITSVFNILHLLLMAETHKTQIPWMTSSVQKEWSFVPYVSAPPRPLQHPDDEMVQFYHQADIAYLNRDFQTAISMFNEYVELYPDTTLSGMAQFQLAESYRHLGQDEKALKAYDNFIVHYPHDEDIPNAFLTKADVYLKLDKWVEAISHLKYIIHRFPGSTAAQKAQERLDALEK